MSQDDHEVGPEVARRFLSGTANGEERGIIIRHLLKDCPTCRAQLVPAQPPLDSYDQAFARAEAAVKRELARQAVRPLLAELEATAPEQQEFRVRNSRRFASLDLAELLAERSVAAGHRDPAAMWLDARLAVAAADNCEGSASGPQLLADARARAWAALGNAHRLRSEIAEAESAFAAAHEQLQAGTGAPCVRAWYCRLRSSLYLFHRQFASATALAEEAVEAYSQLQDPAGEGAALILVAITSIYAGDPRRALPLLDRSVALARECDDEPLARLAINNIVRAYSDLGAFQEAHAVVQSADSLFEFCDEEIVRLKWKWNAARLERDLGLFPSAIARLEAVREGFLERGLRVEVADVSLDLADVYLRTHDGPGVLRTIGETVPIYRALGATRELLASLLQLTQSVHDHEQAVTLFAAVSPQLRGLLEQTAAPLPG